MGYRLFSNESILDIKRPSSLFHTMEQNNGKIASTVGNLSMRLSIKRLSTSVEIHLDFNQLKTKACHMEEGGDNKEVMRERCQTNNFLKAK